MKWLPFYFAFAGIAHANLFFTPGMISSHLQGYSEEEKAAIEKDCVVVESVCFSEAPLSSNSPPPFYLATAGAPGARKTTILERFVAEHPEYQGALYLDPDPRTLRFMVHTYYSRSLNPLEISKVGDYQAVLKHAYDKWRGASNYIVLTLLEKGFDDRRSIVYGTTSTGGHMPQFFPKLKEAGYRLVLLLCSCEDALRKEAISYRNQVVGFYQSSPEDAVSKGKLFPKRMEIYFAEADELYLFWSDALFSPERLAARIVDGHLRICDREAFDLFVQKYERDRQALQAENVDLLPFEEILHKYGIVPE